jgi:2-methylaconitate cis-trans-isomerase PrpF
MAKEEIYGVTRNLLAAVGGFAVARGWVDSETAVSLAGAFAAIAAATWSVKAKRTNKKGKTNGV